MAWTAIVKKDDYSIPYKYEDLVPGGIWGDSELYSPIEIPGELDKDCIKAQDDGEGGIEIVEDSTLVSEKVQTGRDAQLALMREQREPKLLDVDLWVNQITLSYSGLPATADIKTYRDALLAVTDDYKDTDPMVGTSDLDAFEDDLSDFTWPTVPTP